MVLNRHLADKYKSSSQKIRVMSESWVGQEIFCPSCGKNIVKYQNNKPVADFYCPGCSEDFELKSKEGKFGTKIVNGEYNKLVERLIDNRNPNFFLLGYDLNDYNIIDFLVIPKYFFTPNIIEKRKPLSDNARRAGWVGCNINLQSIPQAGRIFYIQQRQVIPKTTVLANWQKTVFLKNEPVTTDRRWILDVMSCIDKIAKYEFVLSDIYSFENELKQKHPRNQHIKEKIRQQLQLLRENGYLKFLGRGHYRLVQNE